MLKHTLLTAAFLAASHGAYAQQAPQAGGQLQQIPPALAPEKTEPGLRVEKPGAPAAAAPSGPTTTVRSLRVTGATVFDEAELVAASGFREGQALTLGELRDMAARIAALYNRHGYFLAQAYLPAQEIRDGVVTVNVIEGRYGKVGLDNRSRLKDGVAQSVLEGLDPGDLVAATPLERRLLLLSDIPGVIVNSTLSPGAAVGTSDLSIGLTPGPRMNGSIEADNAGSRYTGPYRLGGTLRFNNPTGHGDVGSLRVLASDSGLAYGRAAYETRVGIATAGVSYAYLSYDLGREYEALDAQGHAGVASLYGSYPLVRARSGNLRALANLDIKTFRDEVGLTSSTTRRNARVLTLGLDGDHRDGFAGGGWSVFSLNGSVGDLDIRSPLDQAADALTARTNGSYGKLQFSAARLQSARGPLSIYGAVRGQIASKNLDTSEKMELGGAYAVRAYPEGEAYGDEGYVATLEARLRLPTLAMTAPGQVELIGFVDAGAVRSAKSPWSTDPNFQHRSGVGVGVNLDLPAHWLLRVSYAQRLGDDEPTSSPGRARRTWVQVAKLF